MAPGKAQRIIGDFRFGGGAVGEPFDEERYDPIEPASEMS